MDQLSYRRHRFPPPIIQHAIWLYLRFTLSYRDVEELLAERGLEVSYETVPFNRSIEWLDSGAERKGRDRLLPVLPPAAFPARRGGVEFGSSPVHAPRPRGRAASGHFLIETAKVSGGFAGSRPFRSATTPALGQRGHVIPSHSSPTAGPIGRTRAALDRANDPRSAVPSGFAAAVSVWSSRQTGARRAG